MLKLKNIGCPIQLLLKVEILNAVDLYDMYMMETDKAQSTLIVQVHPKTIFYLILA